MKKQIYEVKQTVVSISCGNKKSSRSKTSAHFLGVSLGNKRSLRSALLTFSLLLSTFYLACEQDPPDSGGGGGQGGVDPLAGDKIVASPAGLEVSFNMRYVPPGRFQRDGGAANISVINEGYWMGETEVTQQLWTAVMGYNPSHERHEQLGYLRRRQSFLAQGIWMPVLAVLDFLSGAAPEIKTMPESALFKAQARLNERLWRLAHSNPGTPFDPEGERAELLPVETVNWYDAITFCNKLSLLDGLTPVYSVEGVSDWGTFHYNYIPFEAGDPRNAVWDRAVRDADANGYRLPTEMEWMWAAMGAERGGDDVRTNGYAKTFAGESGASLLINYVWDHGTAGQRTHQTGLKYANELGLFDMSGNVSEWCCDRDAALPPMTLYDYQGPSAPGTGRIVKGVHFYSYQGATLASRSGLAAYLRDEYYGFRIVRMRN